MVYLEEVTGVKGQFIDLEKNTIFIGGKAIFDEQKFYKCPEIKKRPDDSVPTDPMDQYNIDNLIKLSSSFFDLIRYSSSLSLLEC